MCHLKIVVPFELSKQITVFVIRLWMDGGGPSVDRAKAHLIKIRVCELKAARNENKWQRNVKNL